MDSSVIKVPKHDELMQTLGLGFESKCQSMYTRLEEILLRTDKPAKFLLIF